MTAGPWDNYASADAPPQADGPWAKYATPPSAEEPHTTWEGAGKAALTGLAQGVAGVAGLPGDARALTDRAATWAGNEIAGPIGGKVLGGINDAAAGFATGNMPNSSEINGMISAPTGGYYQPKTTAEKYINNVASFVPGAALPGGPIARAARVLVPGVASEAAGEATQGSSVEPYVRALGALAGGGLEAAGEVGLPKVANALGGAKAVANVPQQAADYVSGMLKSAGKTPTDLDAAASATQKPITGAETIGKPAEVALAALARRPGTTPDMANAMFADRAQGAPDRILDDFSQASGVDPNAARGDIDSLVAAGRAKVKPMFDQALASTDPVWNPDLARLAQRPVVQKALNLAASDLRNGDIDPTGFGLPLEPTTGTVLANQAQPTAQAWDLVKKNLNGMVERDVSGKILPDTVSRGNYNINQANRDLTETLRSAIPGYGDALDASGEYLSSKAAFDSAQKMLGPQVPESQFASHIAGLTPAQLEAFKGGIANTVYNQAQNGRLRPASLMVPRVQAKLQMALGPNVANQFTTAAQQEMQMAQAGARIRPGAGSQTAELGAEMMRQDGTPNQALIAGANFMQDLHNSGLIGAVLKSTWRIGNKAVSSYRTGGLTPEARDEAGRALMLPPDQLAAYLRTHASAAPAQSLTGRIAAPMQAVTPALPGQLDTGQQ